MNEQEEREKARTMAAGNFANKIIEEKDYSEEEVEAFRLGVYVGVKATVQMDVFEAIWKGVSKAVDKQGKGAKRRMNEQEEREKKHH